MKTYFENHWKVGGFRRRRNSVVRCRACGAVGFPPQPVGQVPLLRHGGGRHRSGLGRGGMLTLGQGVFFGLGAYIMAMHLKIADAAQSGSAVPDFMQIAGKTELPAYWKPFTSPLVTILAILIVPALVATVLGLGVFKRRVKGAYFAILSQALAAASRFFWSANRRPVAVTA